MPIIQCPITDCQYATEDVEPAVAAVLLTIHNNTHVVVAGTAPTAPKKRAPPIDRPRISKGCNEVSWNAFQTRWTLFKRGSDLTPDEKIQHLFQCCDEDLGNDILKGHPQAVSGTEGQLLTIIKQLAVTPVAVSVRRSELLSLKQDHSEGILSFFARINGKAATCSYSIVCCSDNCTQNTDFTHIIVKDVLITGLVNDEIKREVLGWTELDTKRVDETVSFIEGKEMAWDTLNNQPIAAAVSSYKANSKTVPSNHSKVMTTCKDCNKQMEQYSWSKRQNRMIECTLCLKCWQKANPRKPRKSTPPEKPADETSAILIGAIASSSVEVSITNSSAYIASISEDNAARKRRPIVIDHHIFHSTEGWRKTESLQHPTLRLRLTTEKSDYDHVGASFPKIAPSHVTIVTDTGAQSCLWGLQDFYRCGSRKPDLLPVRRVMIAANREEIQIEGAILVRLSGEDARGRSYTAPIMAYVSPSTHRFYLSQQSLVQLGVIPKNFPQVGAAMETSAIDHRIGQCGCAVRSLPPGRPDALRFPSIPANNTKMRAWLVDRYSASTFNKCPHQQLKGMTGPDI